MKGNLLEKRINIMMKIKDNQQTKCDNDGKGPSTPNLTIENRKKKKVKTSQLMMTIRIPALRKVDNDDDDSNETPHST